MLAHVETPRARQVTPSPQAAFRNLGFVAASECMKNKLLAYGADALYMIRRAGKPAQRTPSSCPKDASSH